MDATDVRNVQINQAQNNPNILSPLSGASSPIQLEPQQQQAYQNAAQQQKDLAGKLYGGGPAPGMAQNIDDMTKQLFAYDQQLEKGQSPFPQLPYYQDNAVDLYRGGAQFGQALGGTINQTQSAVNSLNQAYQNSIAGVMDKFLEFYKLSQEDKRMQQEQQKKNTQVVDLGGSKVLIDSQTGDIIKTLANSGGSLFDIGSDNFPYKINPTTTQGSGTVNFPAPPYTPARAGIVENYKGKTFRSDDKHRWVLLSSPVVPTAPPLTQGPTAGSSAVGTWR